MKYKMIPSTMLIVVLLLFLSVKVNAQVKIDTVSYQQGDYNPEIGYFQKAFSDKGDPRFMFTDKEGKFAIGIGGTIHATSFFDFSGTVENSTSRFTPEKLSIPTDYSRHFGLDAVSSEAHIKVRSNLGKHQIIGYISGVVNDEETFKLDKAYVSFDGLSIGRIYSFFMDLEAGARTVDLQGVNSQIACTQPLIGYKYRFKNGLELGISAERPNTQMSSYAEYGFDLDNQCVPDIAIQGHYRTDKGHLQIAGIYRNISYWLHDPNTQSYAYGETEHAFGWGVMASGSYKALPTLKFSLQGFYGKGITRYVNSMGSLSADLTVNEYEYADGVFAEYPKGSLIAKNAIATPVFGGMFTATYFWKPKLYSSIIVGYNHLYKKDKDIIASDYSFKKSLHAVANIFYDVDDYCTMGLEYNYGQRWDYDKIDNHDTGHANRLAATFIYQF